MHLSYTCIILRWTCWTVSEVWTSTYFYVSFVWLLASWSLTCALPYRDPSPSTVQRPMPVRRVIDTSSSVWNDCVDYSESCLKPTTSSLSKRSTETSVNWEQLKSSTSNWCRCHSEYSYLLTYSLTVNVAVYITYKRHHFIGVRDKTKLTWKHSQCK